MSLKAFHLVFIIASMILAGWMTFWCFMQFKDTQNRSYTLFAMACAASGISLMIYLIQFISKMKTLPHES